MAYNARNNGGTAHLFGTTKKPDNLKPMSQPRPAEQRKMPRQQPMSPMQAPTFAQMQQAGVARPAPAQAQAAVMDQQQMGGGPPSSSGLPDYSKIPGLDGVPYDYTPPQVPASQPTYNPYTAQTAANLAAGQGGMMNELMRKLQLGPSSRFDTDLYTRLRDQALGDLDAAFAGRRQALNEDMARRGLYSSSGELGAGGRLGDLEGQYARARTGMETDLLRSAAETQWQDRMQQNQLFMQIAQMLAGMKPEDLRRFLSTMGG